MAFKDKHKLEGEKILDVDAAMSGNLTFKDPVNLRINGKLTPISEKEVLDAEYTKELAFCLLTEQQQEKFKAFKDIDLSFAYNEKARFRATIYQQLGKV